MHRAFFFLTRPVVLAFALGLVMALGQPPVAFWPAGLVALFALTALVADADTWAAALRRAWAGGAGHFALSLSWIVEPFLVDIARHGWMAPFALAALAGGLALFWAVAGAFAGWAGPGPRLRALAFAIALAAAELSRGYLFTGFPWALPGHIWIGTAPMQLAALIGQNGLTLMTTLAAALPLVLPLGPLRGAGLALSGALLGLAALWGSARLALPVAPMPDAPLIRLIQPNAAQHLKWRPDMIPVFWERQLAFTADPENPAPDLVVWPETAIPVMLGRGETALAAISAAARDRPVIAGIQRRDAGGVYNSLVVIGPGGGVEQVYDKHHLVPFGEYVPFAALLGRLGVKGLAAADIYGYAAGPGPAVLDLGPRLGTALPLICYEAVFPQDLRTGTRPGWLLHITNDAWFGARSGPYQHLALARLRAVEQGLPLLRAANTGVSAVIDPAGRVLHALPLGTAGHLTVPLPPARPETVYAETGDWPVAAILSLAIVGIIARRQRIRD